MIFPSPTFLNIVALTGGVDFQLTSLRTKLSLMRTRRAKLRAKRNAEEEQSWREKRSEVEITLTQMPLLINGTKKKKRWVNKMNMNHISLCLTDHARQDATFASFSFPAISKMTLRYLRCCSVISRLLDETMQGRKHVKPVLARHTLRCVVEVWEFLMKVCTFLVGKR